MGEGYARITPGGLHRQTAPLDQRLALRMPRCFKWVRKAILGFRPASHIRRAFLGRAFRLGFSNYERNDFESTVSLFYSPSVRLERGDIPGLPPDMPSVVEGHADLRRWLEGFHEAFAWIMYEIPEVLDFGDRMTFTMFQAGEGKASGARAELSVHSAIRFGADAAIVWQRFYRDRDEALRGVDVDPAAIEPRSPS